MACDVGVGVCFIFYNNVRGEPTQKGFIVGLKAFFDGWMYEVKSAVKDFLKGTAYSTSNRLWVD